MNGNQLDMIFGQRQVDASGYPVTSYPEKSFQGGASNAPTAVNNKPQNKAVHKPTALITVAAIVVIGFVLWHWNYMKD